MIMNQLVIRQKRALIKVELADADEAREVALAKLRALQRRCEHPDLRTYSAMGESGKICDDCGYQT